MKFIPRRESSATRKAKSSRATEQGVAGHQAVMKALGKAAGGWKRNADDPNIGPKLRDRASIAYTDTPARKNDWIFEPGSTNKGNK